MITVAQDQIGILPNFPQPHPDQLDGLSSMDELTDWMRREVPRVLMKEGMGGGLIADPRVYSDFPLSDIKQELCNILRSDGLLLVQKHNPSSPIEFYSIVDPRGKHGWIHGSKVPIS